MSQPFLDLALIVTRLQVQLAASIKLVGEAIDLGAAIDDLKNVYPAAYVLPNRDQPGSNILANVVSQEVTTTFSVLLAVRNLRDATGARARAELLPLRSGVADALLGWTPGPYNAGTETFTPSEDYTPCEYAGGRLMQLTDTVLWWMDDYRTRFEVRKT